MALSDEDKAAIKAALLASRETTVDGLTTKRRSAQEYREILELIDDLDNTPPTGRVNLASFDPPGSLDG